jgi:hypothetical protein
VPACPVVFCDLSTPERGSGSLSKRESRQHDARHDTVQRHGLRRLGAPRDECGSNEAGEEDLATDPQSNSALACGTRTSPVCCLPVGTKICISLA